VSRVAILERISRLGRPPDLCRSGWKAVRQKFRGGFSESDVDSTDTWRTRARNPAEKLPPNPCAGPQEGRLAREIAGDFVISSKVLGWDVS